MVQRPRGASGGTSASADLSFAGGGKAVLCRLLQEQRIKDPQNFALSPWRYTHVLEAKLFFKFSCRRKASAFFFLLLAHPY